MNTHARLCLIVSIGLAMAGWARAGDARGRRFVAKTADEARQWQAESRKLLWGLMKLDDLVAADRIGRDGKPGISFDSAVLATRESEKFTRFDMEINSTPARRIKVILTIPKGKGPFPAVVCIHGHGGTRAVVHEPGIYRAFAAELAGRGYVTIAADVGQHEVYEKGRTLMGERLWDLVRCVSYLQFRPEVDPRRIGCAGLSLGGEMAMWLGAMDERIVATVSSGYLTTVANMRQGHCPCWEFPGLTDAFDWADIYSLIAPRPLQCQIGQKEPDRGGFPLRIARIAYDQVLPAYRLLSKEASAELAVHPDGHVFVLDAALRFLNSVLKGS